MLFDITLRLVEQRAPQYMRLVSEGDLIGTGEWILRDEGGKTAVTYVWNVTPRRRALRLAGGLPFLRRRMELSHDRVMAAGQENLARLLAAGA